MAVYAITCQGSPGLNSYQNWIACSDHGPDFVEVSADDADLANVGVTQESSEQLVAELTTLVSTFDPGIFEAVTAALFLGLAVGWSGGLILNAINKGKRI